MARGAVPIGCNHITMFIDIQKTLLFYAIAAWEESFTGYILDYGTYPDQKRQYFTLRDARNTFSIATRTIGVEGTIYAGLTRLTESLLSRE